MALKDPLFSQPSSADLAEPAWWRRPVILVVLLAIVAAAITFLTNDAPRHSPQIKSVEIPFEVNYVDEVDDTSTGTSKKSDAVPEGS